MYLIVIPLQADNVTLQVSMTINKMFCMYTYDMVIQWDYKMYKSVNKL